MSESKKYYYNSSIWNLFLLFLGLKLANVGQVASWSWWTVTSPVWGSWALIAFMFVLLAIVGAFSSRRY